MFKMASHLPKARELIVNNPFDPKLCYANPKIWFQYRLIPILYLNPIISPDIGIDIADMAYIADSDNRY